MEFVSSELVKKLMEKVEFMEFVPFELAKELKEKGYKEKCFAYYFPNGSCLIFNQNPFRGGIVSDCLYSNNSLPTECVASDFIDAPTIEQVLKWLREKNIDIEIHTECGLLGYKVYIPYVSTYEEYTLKDDSDIIRYKQKRRNTATPLPNEIIQPFDYFDSYEEAAIAGIEYTLNHLL